MSKILIPKNSKDAFCIQSEILQNVFSNEELVDFFNVFDLNLLTPEIFEGLYKASLNAMINLNTQSYDFLDTCGTGGDGKQTFNISTLSALVCASVGVKVAKHGNRSASGLCGSADVLENLGVNINLKPNKALKILEKIGITFMLAPLYHPAFLSVKQARKIYGKKTYFNLLGPLLNPAKADYRLIGAGDDNMFSILQILIPVLKLKRVLLVRSLDGLDEISPCSDSKILEFKNGELISLTSLNPKNLNFPSCDLTMLQISSTQQAVEIFLKVLEGHGSSAQNSAVILNSAAGLYCAGKVKSIEEGIKMAYNAIYSGKALAKFEEFKTLTNQA